MLSDVSITALMSSGDIHIRPWDERMLGAARVTLHLGGRILVPVGDAVIDVKRGTLPSYREVAATDEVPFLLAPGMFVLAETAEEIGLSEKVGMLLDGRSTLARLGLSVTQTAMIVDTGQMPKRMTLEIKNNGPQGILLYPGMQFCRACFFLIDPPARRRYDDPGAKYVTGDAHRPIFEDEF